MQKISLITSLYRSENYLPLYIQRVKSLLAEATIPLEFVLVANDATREERALLETFPEAKIIHCEREPLYASWNRGIEASTGEIIAFWNVDDSRTLEGLIETQRLLSTEAELVDFALKMEGQKEKLNPPQYRPDSLSPKAGVSAFFSFRRSLYNKADAFFPHFRITGDFEWSKREIVRQARYIASPVVAGTFFVHEGNLSGGRNPLQEVEFNIALIWHGGENLIRPVEPELMRKTWEAWGHKGGTISNELAEKLWGKAAEKRYQSWQAERNAHPLIRRLRLALARRGLFNSVEWDVAHGK